LYLVRTKQNGAKAPGDERLEGLDGGFSSELLPYRRSYMPGFD